MSYLIALATQITFLKAVCRICGEDADRTQRLVNGEPAKRNAPVILIGGEDYYEPRCLRHHCVPD